MNAVADLIKATKAASAATGMRIATSCKRGLFRVEAITYEGRKATIDPLSGFIDMHAAIRVLEQIAIDKGWKQ